MMAKSRSGSATPRVVDFAEAQMPAAKGSSKLVDDRPRLTDGKLATSKQIRARARRMMNRGAPLTEELFEAWCGKPIDDWDLEELSRGRTRDKGGGFRGRPTPMLTREVHERIMDRFKMVLRQEMNAQAGTAIGVIQNLLLNNDVDSKDKPIVSPATKLQAAQWLIEHVVGKPVQPRTDEVSVKLEGILGTVMVNPIMDDTHPDARNVRAALPAGYSLGHIGTREIVDAELVDDDD